MQTLIYLVTVLLHSVPVIAITNTTELSKEAPLGLISDARVTDVRLTNSNENNNYGILEVWIDGNWTAVCDDNFEDNAVAEVACRQLNFVDGTFQPGSALGKQSDVVIKPVNLDCLGNETSLSECNSSMSNNCLSDNYITLYCSRRIIVDKVRLMNSNENNNYGILEVSIDGNWTAVCDDNFKDNAAAEVACRQLNFVDGTFQPGSALGKQADVDIKPVNLDCLGNETSLSECNSSMSNNCLSDNYVTLYCSRRIIVDKVRLTNSNKNNNYGILEVSIDETWTAVCDDNFEDNAVAEVACRQLNFVDGRFQPGSAVGRLAQVVIKAVKLDCHGNETNLSECSSTMSNYCLSENYVTLYCSPRTIVEKECVEIRIKGGHSFGLLEANQYGFWGPICDFDWTDLEADAACRELGKAGGYAYYAVSHSDDPMVVGRFNCTGGEGALKHCDFKGFGEALGCQYPITKGYRRTAGVFCYDHLDGVQFRLTDRWYGKVQVKHDGEWGRVCNTNWGNKEASTLCRQLGYIDGRADSTTSSESDGEVRINDVNCTGSESSILECSHQASWSGSLSKCNDAEVICEIKICGTMDVRNSVDSLNQLRYCNVIEGNLTILLIAGKWEDFQKYSFPNLVEITEYLVLFRVDNLRSLNHLFPNLAIIRGDRLFNDYALVAFEMPNLVELGLSSLVSIPRGAVRLEKNPNLCYIETIDWEKITTGVTMSDNYFTGNKDVQECVNKCPNGCDQTLEYDKKVPRCWTINECQKMLSIPADCPSGLYSDGVCCHSNCMAGCTGPSPQQCTTCRNVMQHVGKRIPTCTQRCSAGTYTYKDRRCLLAEECLNFKDYRTVRCYDQNKGENINCLKLVVSEDNSKPGHCVADCPANYKLEDHDQQKCERCQGKCPKSCVGKVIDSVLAAHELKDCNIINGPLQINIRQGGQIAQELEENFAQIEEITDFIIISHSEALMSLHFLKGLRKIGGQNLAYGKYIFYVYDNLNLQELFLDDVTQGLQIGNGSVLFQYNRKLCYKKITKFISSVGLDINKIDSEEVSSENNGDQMPCEIQNLTLKLHNASPHIGFVSWTPMRFTDDRHFIGYSINWKEAPEKNVSIYKGRDACSDDLWKSKDVCTGLTHPSKCPTLDYIVGLEPWTQYAAYVKALTVSKSVQGGISDVIYFRTDAEVPTPPVNLKVIAKVPGELEVTWGPPDKPNGNVTHYEIYWQKQKFDESEYELRNYCSQPLTKGMSNREKELKLKEEEKKNSTADDTCCACPKSETQQKKEERERNLGIQFQDNLQNQVYIKRLTIAATTMLPSAATVSRYLLGPYTESSKKSIAKLHQVKKYKQNSNPQNPKQLQCQSPGDDRQKPLSTTVAPSGNNSSSNVSTTTPVTSEEDLKVDINDENTFLKADVYEKRKFIITGLGHFEVYNIEVTACHTRPPDPKKDMLCGNQALGFGRTVPDDTADSINSSLVQVNALANRTGAVHIKWKDPPNPNGLILTYDIEYMNQNINNVKPTLICITYAQYRDEGKGGHILDKLEPGNYTFKLRATSLAGNGSWTDPVYFNIEDNEVESSNTHMVIAVSVTCVVAIPIAVVIVWFLARRKYVKLARGGVLISTNPDYPEMAYFIYEPDEWEVDRDNVQLIKDLGQGSFGMVYMGIVKNLVSGEGEIKVAVKTTNENSTDHDRYQFLQEASIMKQFSCHHVVKLIGVVSQGQPAYVLMELMLNGDLKHFLRLHRPDEEENDGRQPPTLKQILQMAGEIADGMAYLADKKFVHRDLAARNCMVGEDMTVKIGDFGMTRDIYETDYYRKGSRGLLPVRWMPPESLKDGVFTSLTDVWSYGVVLWEMATLAAQPYQGLSNEQVLKYVSSGKIMDAPDGCPTKLYDLMVKCWRYRPKQRPTFKEIIELLLPDLDLSFRDCSYFFSEESAKYEEAKQTSGASQSHDDNLFDSIDKDEDEDDLPRPMNDYVDEANLPMLGIGASNGHDLELHDICSDTGMYPHHSSCSSHNRNHDCSGEVCDCNTFREQAGAAGQSLVDIYKRNNYPSPNSSAKGGSSDGSKESSKSSSSSYAHMNGLSVANGHVPLHLQRTTPC